ncbi:hypothetical protein AG1IA_06283 [Rhizoctonia solani AG-1 IA]|uniref:Uncharacterized protein n=1 Tax=Thanatephorus cucumeris (strain AG1-IA) TaxID=983506 RepID=L8WNE8_THACA|nr:hypothetical protein AG1IA_06283 [Rhizoctonia solani AG-1 IA]
MSHSGSKSLLQRISRSALAGSRFRTSQSSKGHQTLKEDKAVVCESHSANPKGTRTAYHMSYWHTVAPQNQRDASCRLHERNSYPPRVHENPPSRHPNHADKLSSPIPRPRKSFNLDKFIQENENWTPPSPTENFARRLFMEARQGGTQPQNTPKRPSGDYLVRRTVKERVL